MAEDGHCTSSLHVLLWWDPRAFFFFFNTLDDGTNEGLVAVQRTRRALHNPLQLSTTFPLPKYTGLCYKVPLGKLRSGRKEALSP